MKKLILLFIAIFIVGFIYATDQLGSYHVSFDVSYSNKSMQILQLKHIYSYAYMSTDNYTHDFTTYNAGFTEETNDEASLFKTIKTFTPEKGITIEENSYNITRFSIDKSPNNGTFTSHIELSAKADVILYLYNASTGHIVDTQEVKNNKSYDIPFSVKTLAGEYILLLIVPEWEKSSWIKMLII